MTSWRELLEMDFLSRFPTAKEREVIGEIEDMGDWVVALRQIREFYPGIITKAGEEYIAGDDELIRESWDSINDERDRENQMGRYAPLITVDEPAGVMARTRKGTATDKQRAYLKTLGVKGQDVLLSRLDRGEASNLIEEVLARREPPELTAEDEAKRQAAIWAAREKSFEETVAREKRTKAGAAGEHTNPQPTHTAPTTLQEKASAIEELRRRAKVRAAWRGPDPSGK